MVLQNRRYLHNNPELSFQEFQTSAYIKKQLDEIGVKWTEAANTGIIAEVYGTAGPGPLVALRADMDALPIAEENTVDYKSANEGVMHACGHDVHMATLLGVVRIIVSLKHVFSGTIRFLFQPAEEVLPGGASRMIDEGVLSNPAPIAVLGQHVRPDIECGKIAVTSGPSMASMDEIYITIHGRGGHAAQPHNNIDPVYIASQLVSAVQQVVSRHADPQIPTVLSFGKFIANGAVNISPDSVYLEGTFRTFDEDWRYTAHEHIKNITNGLVEGMGGRCDLEIRCGYPSVNNNQILTEKLVKSAKKYLGHENVVEVEKWMAAEDFSYYSQKLPSVFYYLGTGNVGKNITAPLHSAQFNIDEDALEFGCGMMAWFALQLLEAHTVQEKSKTMLAEKI